MQQSDSARQRARVASAVPVLVVIAMSATQAFAHGVTRFDNGRWLRNGELWSGSLFAVDGVFQMASEREPDAVVDLGGRYVLPPLGDAHNHALAGPDFGKDSGRYLANGVFYVANPNSPVSTSVAAREQARQPETVDVTYGLAGITSPGGHPVQIYERFAREAGRATVAELDGETFHLVASAADLARVWPRVVANRPDFVKIYLEHSEEHELRAGDRDYYGRRGLDPALVPEVARRARADGLRLAAHVATAADFRVAVEAGVDEIAHLPVERLAPADVRAAAESGVVVVTTALSHRQVEDPDGLEGALRHNLALLSEAGVSLVVGTDSGRGLIDEMLEVARLSGWSAAELIDMATVATPRWIFPQRSLGALEPEHEASFVAYDENPLEDLERLRTPSVLVKGGHVLEVAKELPGVSQILAHTLMRDGVEVALAEYRRLREEAPDAYDFSEPQLNALGYFALNQERVEAAVEVFRLNAELFPASANVWDSLGDGLVAAEEWSEAIEAYRKALSIAPHSEHTREKLAAAELEQARSR